jgi:hypothetical protein
MSVAPSVKLYLFFAEEAERAVILRQGPSRVYRMVLWDTVRDRFEDGQWVRHKIYPERCSLSPDGRHFLYFALNGLWQSETKGAFTAISRPPWFTALALWPQGHTWGGGGVFLDDRHVLLATSPDAPDIVGRAPEIARVFQDTSERAAWRRPKAALGRRRAPIPTGYVFADGSPAPVRTVPAGDRGRGYVTRGGTLYRRRGQDIAPIRDFTDMRFQPLRAPYDWRGGTQP